MISELFIKNRFLTQRTDAEKPKCEELESEFHLYECRPLCATINGRHGRKGGGDIENISDDGTCEKGLKCCIVSYYHDFVGDIRLIDKLDKTPWDD